MIRLLIMDNDAQSGAELAALVQQDSELQVAGQAASILDGLQCAQDCELALVSAALPEDGALNFLCTLSYYDICIPVLIIGSNETKGEILQFIESGARGYITRSTVPQELNRNIYGILRGEAYLPPDVVGDLVARLAELSSWYEEIQPAGGPADKLTRREREVLRLIGRDFTNQDIANHLIIEVGTVKNHVHNILSKLNVTSRREAAAYLPVLRARTRRRKRPLEMEPRETYYRQADLRPVGGSG